MWEIVCRKVRKRGPMAHFLSCLTKIFLLFSLYYACIAYGGLLIETTGNYPDPNTTTFLIQFIYFHYFVFSKASQVLI